MPATPAVAAPAAALDRSAASVDVQASCGHSRQAQNRDLEHQDPMTSQVSYERWRINGRCLRPEIQIRHMQTSGRSPSSHEQHLWNETQEQQRDRVLNVHRRQARMPSNPLSSSTASIWRKDMSDTIRAQGNPWRAEKFFSDAS